MLEKQGGLVRVKCGKVAGDVSARLLKALVWGQVGYAGKHD